MNATSIVIPLLRAFTMNATSIVIPLLQAELSRVNDRATLAYELGRTEGLQRHQAERISLMRRIRELQADNRS